MPSFAITVILAYKVVFPVSTLLCLAALLDIRALVLLFQMTVICDALKIPKN